MARSVGNKIERTFVKGLITEATGLNFPENSCTDTLNCVFDEKGRVTRRYGFEYEGGYETDSFDRSGGVTTEFYWENAGSTASANLVVVQIKNMLHFYTENKTGSLSSTYAGLNINLNSYAAGGTTDIPLYHCSFAAAEGKLFVAHPLCNPFYVTYNPGGPSVSATAITVRVRDLVGDTADTNYNNPRTRPTATTGTVGSAHMYNLYNQGWRDNVAAIGGSTANPVTFWDGVLTTIPSNGDVWWVFKDANDLFDPVNYKDRTSMGSTLAPKGYYIINAFATNRNALSGLTGVTENTSNGLRPSAIASFAGRIWYAGVNADGYAHTIYYSRLVTNPTEYGYCYQHNDPTSEHSSDLLATDGGTINITEIGTVIKLFPMQNNMLVFGTGGVWSISGSQGLGFSATDYAVTKISSTPAISPLSFVSIYGVPIWWNLDGIFSIDNDKITGNAAASSLSDEKIKAFFNGIPAEMKPYVKGAFNPRSKTVQWLYRSTVTTDVDERYDYDSILVLNTLTSAFFPWSLPNTSEHPTVNGLIVCQGPTSEQVLADVVDDLGNYVVSSTGAQVVGTLIVNSSPDFNFRYFTSDKTGESTWDCTWSQTINTRYLDWEIEGFASDYDSYFFTNYQLDGDAIRFFNNNYIVVYSDTLNDGSCLFEAWWDYVAAASSKVTNPQQIYVVAKAVTTNQRRMKIRGKGRSVQFKFYSTTGKPFSIIGWATLSTQNAGV